MKKTLALILVMITVVYLFSCKSSPEVYNGKIGLYDATASVNGDKMTLTLNISEEGKAVVVNNVVKIVGTIKEKNGSIYKVAFADGNTVISIKYIVEGDGAKAYLNALKEFMLTVVKSEADKELVRRLCEGEEISFGIDSALYTSLTGMPGDVTVRFFDTNKSFTIS